MNPPGTKLNDDEALVAFLHRVQRLRDEGLTVALIGQRLGVRPNLINQRFRAGVKRGIWPHVK